MIKIEVILIIMKRLSNSLLLCRLFVLLTGSLYISPGMAGTATQLFEEFKQQVYQIRVIDVASGNKSSIGSGFQVNSLGHVATNFHVVASFVHEPDKYRLEVVDFKDKVQAVTLEGIDIIHDLAIVKLKDDGSKGFEFNLGKLSKGDRIYSMGNPQDLAMTIIEGTYNGLVKQSRYRKILFSGSLNSGMSGGPSFDESGKIVGINVSKGGEQLSFLVPVHHLDVLLKQVMNDNGADSLNELITRELLRDQDSFYSSLFATEWPMDQFMELKLPGVLSKSLKCWGHTVNKNDIRYEGVHQHCRSQDEIYIKQRLVTGKFLYDYEWMSTEQLNRFQLYSLVQEHYSHVSLSNASNKKDITDFSCGQNFIELSNHLWKVSSCVRRYKKFIGLYDTVFILASVDENNKSMVLKVGAAGISKKNAKQLFNKFIGSIQWPH